MKTNANSLTNAIINYIRANGGHAERVNNIARQVTTKSGAKVYIPSANFKGTADIHACKKARFWADLGTPKQDSMCVGLFVAIEVKVGKDKQSEEQARYQSYVERAGGVYMIAHDIDQFIREYDNI